MASGCGRRWPTCRRPRTLAPPLAAGVSVELVHQATLVHDDLIDGARVRRGRAAAWTAHGADAARAAGDYLFARAFSELAQTGDRAASPSLRTRASSLARGEALQRRQRYDPDTTVDAYLERCALKTGKLFEAACLLGGGSGEYGLLLGIAFQIADDILDCTGDTIETGKVAGHRSPRRHADAAAAAGGAGRPRRPGRPRRRPARGRARPRRGERRSRALPGDGARLR